jgi:hypothetical protein
MLTLKARVSGSARVMNSPVVATPAASPLARFLMALMKALGAIHC